MKPKLSSYIVTWLLILPLLGLLASCNFPSPDLARTEQPLYIPPLGPTITPTPTATPDPSAWIKLGAEQEVPEGGFAFSPLLSVDANQLSLSLTIDSEKVSQSNQEQTLFFSLVSEPSEQSNNAADCLSELLARMPADIQNFSSSTPQPANANNLEGLQTDLSGNLFEQPMLGRLAAFHPDGRCFSLLGMAASPEASTVWLTTGQAAFNALLGSVRFLSNQAPCIVASDPTYGFSPDNPIHLGSVNLYDGIARMEAYLNTLRGPNLEEIFYTRLNPTYNKTGLIVDPYQISYDGLAQPLTLYFDLYTYEKPMAPAGFSCEADFPIQQP